MIDDEIDTNDVKRMMMGLLSTLTFEVFGPTLDGITFTAIEDFTKHDIFRTTQQIQSYGMEDFEKRREQIKISHPQ